MDEVERERRRRLHAETREMLARAQAGEPAQERAAEGEVREVDHLALAMSRPVEDALTADRRWFEERAERWRQEREATRALKVEILPPRPASSAKQMVLTVARETARVFKQYGAEIDRQADEIARLRKDLTDLKTMLRDLQTPQWLSDEISKVLRVADRLEAEHRDVRRLN